MFFFFFFNFLIIMQLDTELYIVIVHFLLSYPAATIILQTLKKLLVLKVRFMISSAMRHKMIIHIYIHIDIQVSITASIAIAIYNYMHVHVYMYVHLSSNFYLSFYLFYLYLSISINLIIYQSKISVCRFTCTVYLFI